MESLKNQATELMKETKEVLEEALKYSFSFDNIAHISAEDLKGIQTMMACGDHFMDYIINEADKIDKLEKNVALLNDKMDNMLNAIQRLERAKTNRKDD